MYSRYGFLKRMMLRAIAKREGGDTDTSKDHVYTDWGQVASFATAFHARVAAASQQIA